MIKARLLNSGASLNDFFFLDALEFVPGENLTLVLQIFDAQKNIRYIPPAAAEMTLTFVKSDGTELEKSASLVDADDRSMWKVSLSQAETATLAGQNVEIELDVNGDASLILKAIIANGVIRINLSGDC